MDMRWIFGAVLAAILITGALAVVWWASQNFTTLLMAAGVIIILGIICIAVWWFSRPQPPQINKMNLQNIRAAADFGGARLREACPEGAWMRGTLNSPGGYFCGWPIKYTSEDLIAKLGVKKRVAEEEGTQFMLEEGGVDCKVRMHYVFLKKTRGLMSFMEKETAFAFFDYVKIKNDSKGKPMLDDADYAPEEWTYSHGPFNGELTLYGNGPIRCNEFMWLSSQVNDPFVDEFIEMKGKNITTHEVLNEQAQFVKTGIKANPYHQMELEMKKDLDANTPISQAPKREED